MIRHAHKLYVNGNFTLDLAKTVCALGRPTIDLCLSLFLSADFRSKIAEVKMHRLLDLQGPPFVWLYCPGFVHLLAPTKILHAR